MIRFYTYLFACAYVNAERIWKDRFSAAFYTFHAWMILTVTVGFNFGAVCFSIPALLGLPYVRVHSHVNLGVPLAVIVASICWLLIVRNGQGLRLAEVLKEEGEDSITKCQLITFTTVFGSVALFFIPLFLFPLWHPPTRAQVHIDGSFSPPTQSQAR